MDLLAFPAATNALNTYWEHYSRIEEEEKKESRDQSVFAVNAGLAYRKPVESVYNAVRRFFASNPAVPPNRLISEVKRSLAVTSYIEHSIFREKPWLSKPSESIFSYRQPQICNCPFCAVQYYHSFLFQLNWFDNCPIHKCELTFKCPDCGLHWPNYRELMARKCETCGFKNRSVPTAVFGNDNTTYDALIVISNLLREQEEFPPQYYDFCDKTYPCNISKETHHIIRSIVDVHPKAEPLFRSVSADLAEVKKRRINYIDVPGAFAFQYQSLDAARIGINAKLKKEIPRLSKINLASSHKLNLYNVYSISLHHNYCPSCMAVSMVLYLLTDSDSGHKYARLDCVALSRFIRSGSGMPLPTLVTEIKDVKKPLASAYEKARPIPTEATLFLYQLSWLKMYERICNYCEWVNEPDVRASLVDGFETEVPEKARFWLPCSVGFELFIGDDSIDIFYEPHTAKLIHNH